MFDARFVKIIRRRKAPVWIFSIFVRTGTKLSIALALILLIIYAAGSIPDPGFSDSSLFMLLNLLRFSSVLLCTFSFFSMGYSVRRVVKRPSVRSVWSLIFYFSTGLISAATVLFYSFIVAVTQGNL
jgi:hypothetical protein